MCVQPLFQNELIFSNMNDYQNPSKDRKNISCRQCSAILFWNRPCDCSDHTTLEDGAHQSTPAQMFQIEYT